MGMLLRSLNHAMRTPLKLRSRGRAKSEPGSLIESGHDSSMPVLQWGIEMGPLRMLNGPCSNRSPARWNLGFRAVNRIS